MGRELWDAQRPDEPDELNEMRTLLHELRADRDKATGEADHLRTELGYFKTQAVVSCEEEKRADAAEAEVERLRAELDVEREAVHYWMALAPPDLAPPDYARNVREAAADVREWGNSPEQVRVRCLRAEAQVSDAPHLQGLGKVTSRATVVENARNGLWHAVVTASTVFYSDQIREIVEAAIRDTEEDCD